MKSIFNVCLLFALFAATAISCTESENLDEVTTRATQSSLILASPTEISFSDGVIGETQTKDVTVVSAGLTPLTVLTAFDIIVQGADASQFSIERPSLSLIGLLEALLGNGYTFTVNYTPTTTETTNATVLVNASILGVLLPTQLEIPVTANADTFDGTGPQLASSGMLTAEFVGFDPEQPLNAIFQTEILFDREIILVGANAVSGPTPGFFRRVFTQGRNLIAQASIALSQVQNFTGTILINVDAIIDANGDPLQEAIFLDFGLGDIPL